MTVENDRMQVTGHSIYLEKENNDVEEGQWNVSSHDIPDPVLASIGTWNARQVEGVCQGIMVRFAPTTQLTSSVVGFTHVVIQRAAVIRKKMVDYIIQVLVPTRVSLVILAVIDAGSSHYMVILRIKSGTVTIQHEKFEIWVSFTRDYLVWCIETFTFLFSVIAVKPQRAISSQVSAGDVIRALKTTNSQCRA